MGIRFHCPNGHKLNVKTFQARMRGICPYCGAKFTVPAESTLPPSGKPQADEQLEEEGQTLETGEDTDRPSPQPVAEETAETRPPGEQPPDEKPPTKRSPDEKPSNEQPSDEQPADGQPTAKQPARKKKTPPVDHLSEEPDAQWYVRPPSGGQFGPAVGEVMRQWIKDGRVTAESLVWREGWPDWLEAVTVFPRLALVRWLPDDDAKNPPPPPPPKPRPQKTAAGKEEEPNEAEREIGPLIETGPDSKHEAARRGGGRRRMRTRSPREIKQRRVNRVIGLSVLAAAMAGVLTWVLMR